MDDKQIIELYFARSEQAIAETQRKYGKYCRYIANRILDCAEDAEEVENDTYLRAWNTIPPNSPEELKPYVGMISRSLALDAYEKRHAGKRSGEVPLILDELAECIPDRAPDLAESFSLRDALNKFVRSLPEQTQKIFIRRYWYASPVAQIALDFSMKESSVTVLMLRTRKKLKAFLEKEGFEL